jgi:hypothetical protein
MLEFTQWLSTTSVSLAIQKAEWIIPVIQIIHILAIAMVLTAVAMITGQILGVVGRSQTMAQTGRRFMPWIWIGLIVLAPTGAVLIIAEPTRTLDFNPAFMSKMLLLTIAMAITGVFQWSLRRGKTFWESGLHKSAAMKAFAVLTIMVWIGVAVTGRWIAYLYHS